MTPPIPKELRHLWTSLCIPKNPQEFIIQIMQVASSRNFHPGPATRPFLAGLRFGSAPPVSYSVCSPGPFAVYLGTTPCAYELLSNKTVSKALCALTPLFSFLPTIPVKWAQTSRLFFLSMPLPPWYGPDWTGNPEMEGLLSCPRYAYPSPPCRWTLKKRV